MYKLGKPYRSVLLIYMLFPAVGRELLKFTDVVKCNTWVHVFLCLYITIIHTFLMYTCFVQSYSAYLFIIHTMFFSLLILISYRLCLIRKHSPSFCILQSSSRITSLPSVSSRRQRGYQCSQWWATPSSPSCTAKRLSGDSSTDHRVRDASSTLSSTYLFFWFVSFLLF